MYRSMSNILGLLLVRALSLIPGFLETMRALSLAGMGNLFMLACIKETVEVLAKQVDNIVKFLVYYKQFYIICNVLLNGASNIVFYAITIAYVLFILVFWMVVRGYSELALSIYLIFCILAVIIVASTCLVLPCVSVAGELITGIVKTKQNFFRVGICKTNDLRSKVLERQLRSLLPIRFSYGSYYPLGKSFSRNLLSNVVKDLLSAILIYDFHGRIYKT